MSDATAAIPCPLAAAADASPSRPFALSLLANHYPALHGLRVLAILAVVQFHVTGELGRRMLIPYDTFARLSQRVFFGMDLFFVLSGFLIGTLLLKSIESARSLASFGRFYWRRSLRIFPLYYAVLTLVALNLPPHAKAQVSMGAEYLYFANYVDGAKIMSWGWSLCVEEHFYVLAPVVLLLILRLETHRARLGLLGLLWAAGLGIRLATFYAADQPWTTDTMFSWIYMRTHTRFDILVAGVATAYVQHHFAPRLVALFEDRAVRFVMLAVPLAALAVLLSPPSAGAEAQVFKLFAWGTLTSVLYVPLVLLFVNRGGAVGHLLKHRSFLVLATLGYGIYLVHIPVMMRVLNTLVWLHYHVHRLPVAAFWPLTFVLTLVLSTGAAYLLHLAVEKPALYLRDRLAP